MLTGSNVCPPPATIHPVTVGTLRSESESTCHWLPDFGQPVFFDFRSMKYEDTGSEKTPYQWHDGLCHWLPVFG